MTCSFSNSVWVGHSRSFCLLVHLIFSSAEAEALAKRAEGGKESYKGDSKFASHLKTSAGVSTFAKNRTLKEQREFLPAFACREDLMKIIRDNQGTHLHISSLQLLTCLNDSCRRGR